MKKLHFNSEQRQIIIKNKDSLASSILMLNLELHKLLRVLLKPFNKLVDRIFTG